MRKFLACSVVALGVLALAACGGGGNNTTSNTNGGGGGDGDLEAFCEEAADSWEKVFSTGAIDLTDDDALDEAVDSAKALADVAPDEISDDMNEIKDIAEDYVNTIKDAGDDEDAREEAREDWGQENEESANDALLEVDGFISEECGGGEPTDVSDFSDFTDIPTDLPTDIPSDFDCEDIASSYDLPDDYCDTLSDFEFSDFDDFSDVFSDLSDFTGN